MLVGMKPGPGKQALRRGRVSQPKRIYFITIVADGRRPWFEQHGTARTVSRLLHRDKTQYDAENLCWVVMPDHVHFLLQLGTTPLEKVINQWKSKSARVLNREIDRNGQFWESGYYDHALRKEENIKDIARYIIGNPLRSGLAKKYGDYPYWNAKWL